MQGGPTGEEHRTGRHVSRSPGNTERTDLGIHGFRRNNGDRRGKHVIHSLLRSVYPSRYRSRGPVRGIDTRLGGGVAVRAVPTGEAAEGVACVLGTAVGGALVGTGRTGAVAVSEVRFAEERAVRTAIHKWCKERRRYHSFVKEPAVVVYVCMQGYM